MISDFAGFDSRKDNKLWVFITKSGDAIVYVIAFTWFEARAGALVELKVSQSDVLGHQVENADVYHIKSGSKIVLMDKQSMPHVTTLSQAMSGREAIKL